MQSRGFSLVEILTVLVIIGIFMLIAIPGYNTFISSGHIGAEDNDLYHDLEFARSEASKRGLNIVVCPSNNTSAASPTCAAQATWNGGWITLLPVNNNCTDTSGTVLRIRQPFTSSDTVTFAPSTAGNNALCFNRMGFVPTANAGLFTFDTSPVSTSARRCLAVSVIGHLQILQSGQKDAAGTQC